MLKAGIVTIFVTIQNVTVSSNTAILTVYDREDHKQTNRTAKQSLFLNYVTLDPIPPMHQPQNNYTAAWGAIKSLEEHQVQLLFSLLIKKRNKPQGLAVQHPVSATNSNH